MKVHICVRCSKTLASPQSLWNHRQRCKASAIKDEKFSSSNGQTRKHDSAPAHKENFLADIINNVRAKDQRTTPILPIKQMNPKPDALIDFKSEEKSQCESDSESTTFNSDSESEETEISEDDQPDDLEELKAAFRNLYKKVHNNMENYNKLVLILDELYHVNCLTKEECDGKVITLEKDWYCITFSPVFINLSPKFLA